MKGLDKFDLRILEILSRNGRITWSELAGQLGLSLTPTLKRVRALEAEGLISGYHATLNEARLGRALSVFVSVSLGSQTDEALAQFEALVQDMPEVMSCFMMTGEVDYLLRIAVADVEGFQAFISRLTRFPGVQRVTSSFAVKPVVQRAAPPLQGLVSSGGAAGRGA